MPQGDVSFYIIWFFFTFSKASSKRTSLFITRDDVVSQRHKLGSAFLSIVFFLGVKNCFVFFFFKFTLSRARPKKLCDFYWLQRREK